MVVNFVKTIILTNDKSKAESVFKELFSGKKNAYGFECNYVFDEKDVINSEGRFDDVEYILSTWGMPVFTKEQISLFFPRLKAVFYAAGTVKYFAKPYLLLGIKVFTASKFNAIPVSEFVTSLIILSNKGFFQSCRCYGSFFLPLSYKRAKEIAASHKGNYKAKVGIIGAGLIGKRVIGNLNHFDLEVLVYDPYVDKRTINDLGGIKVECVDEIFSKCDVISNHLPDNNETKCLIGEQQFKKMKPYSTIINTGRGAQINEKDMIKHLKRNKTITAILDVLSVEPVRPFSPLKRMRNVFLTPHIAGSMACEETRLGNLMIDILQMFINNENLSDYEVEMSMMERGS